VIKTETLLHKVIYIENFNIRQAYQKIITLFVGDSVYQLHILNSDN